MNVLVRIWNALRSKVKKFRFDRDFFIFLFFLILSSIFWFFSQLGKETQAVISYPVRYEITFPGRILVNKLPPKLKLAVKGDGYTLLKHMLTPRLKSIKLDVQSYPLRPLPGEEKGNFYLLTSYVRGSVSDQLPDDLSLIGITPDTIIFVFDSVVSEKIPVRPDVDLNLSRQVMLRKGLDIKPDSVQVSGPERIMDTTRMIKTKFVRYENVEKSFSDDLPLVKIPGLTITPGIVKLTVDVEQFTESTVEVPIQTRNVPDTLVLKVFPSRVKVLFYVVLSRYNQIGPASFEVVVDYNAISSRGSGKVPVTITRQPEDIGSVRLAPERVDYLIEKKR